MTTTTAGRRSTSLAIAISLAAAAVGINATPVAANAATGADPVITWNGSAGEAAIAACIAPTLNPLDESRMYAMMHIAVHDALNAIDRRFQPYAFDATVDATASVDAAVAAAAHDVLVPTLLAIPAPFPPSCGQGGAASVEEDYAAFVAAIPEGPAKDAGLAVGQDSAAAILALRADDGSDTPRVVTDYPQGDDPGEYRFTPGNGFAFAPGWGEVDPFVLRKATQYGPGKPYRIRSKRYADDYAEVKRLGGDGITTPSARTPDQTQIAQFWVESSPLQWNRIARTVATDAGRDPWENARMFGVLNIAMADGYIASFAAKYQYNFWRPVTAIHEGDADGNRRTTGDPTWTPLVPTPAIPDHDSAHAVEGAAAATVLTSFFGTSVSFATCSLSLPAGQTCADAGAVFRTYTSFADAASENGESRILVGFHFRHAVEDGLVHGTLIALRSVFRTLRPSVWSGL